LGEFHPDVVGRHYSRGDLPSVYNVASVPPDIVGGNIIERSSQNLKGACAFIEEGFLKFWVVEPPGLCGTRPLFREHHVADVFGNNAIECHMFNVPHLHAVGASVVSLLAMEPNAYWEGIKRAPPIPYYHVRAGQQ
jgi:hypothetical protein